MEIVIEKFKLASHGIESVNDYSLEGARQKEIRTRFRGLYPKIFDRGNEIITISFTMHKEFVDYVQAFEWLHDLPKLLPRDGVATITESNGLRASVRKFNLAHVQVFGGTLIGCTVRHSYRLIGTELTKPIIPAA